MESVLSPEHYRSPDIQATENQRIFRRLWIYACTSSAVAEHEAFVTRNIGGVSLIIHNFDGRLRALENVCPHRLMPIQAQEFGQGKLLCPYHGWSFHPDGKVKSIPKEDVLYRYSPEAREELCLREFSVACIGKLVFVNLDPCPIDIHEQFSSNLISKLEEISGHFGDTAAHLNMPTKYNWKLNFENVLDSNHVPYVHPKSFQPLMVNVNKHIEEPDDDVGAINTVSAALTDQSFHAAVGMKIDSWPWHELVDRFGTEDAYHNFFLFPNVNFISVGGLVFLIQQFHPISALETEVRFTICVAREKHRLPALPAILRGHLKGEVDVFNEDLAYLERLQSSLSSLSQRVRHGKYEHRLQSFAAAYSSLMESAT
jgi:phenylpropionate dioxygenase-like ring-hydroxylating dioxygenase large terminal subunit